MRKNVLPYLLCDMLLKLYLYNIYNPPLAIWILFCKIKYIILADHTATLFSFGRRQIKEALDLNRKWIIPVIVLAFMCTSCALVPKEEQLPEAPVLHISQGTQYTQVAVTRGDIVKEVTIDCTYEPATEEILSFPIGGERIAEIYVSRGDQVKAGDLLAELDNRVVHEKISTQQEKMDALQLQLTQVEEKLNLYWVRCALLDEAEAASPQQYGAQSSAVDQACDEIYDDYNYLKGLLEVEQLAMDELRQELAMRQIYAGIDGTVLTVTQSSTNSDYTLFPGQTVCIIADLTTGIFSATIEGSLLQIGDTVIITYDGQGHEAQVSEITDGKSNKKMSGFS